MWSIYGGEEMITRKKFDFINKTYSVPSRSKMRPALGKYLEATKEERTEKLKLFAKQRNVKFID